jgi:protein TonB
MEMHAPEPPQAANELKPFKPAPVVAAPAIPTSMPAAMPAAVAATPAKKPPVVPAAIGAIVVIGIAIAYFATRKPAPAPVVAKPAVVQTQTTATSIAATSTAPLLGTTSTTSTAPAIDASKVNEEVAKRMAAEKARLDQLARTQNQQTTTARAVAAAPAPQQVATQTIAPPPVIPAPVPQPPAPTPQPVAENRPAPQPEAPRTQVGDLVPAGTPGLTPAHMTHQAAAQYPPIARVQHVQGSVVVSVLVSETGQVLETRVVSGPQAVLNEAAQQSIRRSTFAAGEKDGVRVKSWTNVRVDFKL